MKAILIFITLLLVTNTYRNNVSKNTQTTSMEYEYYSRGSYRKVVINNQVVAIYDNRDAIKPNIEKKITDANWAKLNTELEKLNFDAIATYKDPTQKRFYDGAPIAGLVLIYNNVKYKSKAFDHGDPPAELKKLIDTINEIAEL